MRPPLASPDRPNTYDIFTPAEAVSNAFLIPRTFGHMGYDNRIIYLTRYSLADPDKFFDMVLKYTGRRLPMGETVHATKTLEALQGSIEKWEAIVAGTGVDAGIKNCPLCVLFWNDGCYGCPVFEKTGGPGCAASPYNRWDESFEEADPDDPWRAATPERVALAQAELDFLKSLLPQQ